MTLRRLIAMIGLLAMASGCTTAAPPADGPRYYVLRHLHTPQHQPGGDRDPELLPEGQQQAEQLAAFRFGQAPRAIYVSTYRRTLQTAAPLAARLRLDPIVYDPADTPGLVARVKAGPLPALIVGHSNTVPDIVEQLGGARPEAISLDRFGDVWIIGPSGGTEQRRIEAE